MNLKIVRDKLIGDEEQRAVSPVIGVILMVAITVILAAVIAAFVLDLGSGLENSAQAGVDVQGDGTSEVTVTVESLANADKVEIRNDAGNQVSSVASGSATLDSVGATATVDDSDPGTGDYTVVALYEDDSGANNVASFTIN